MLRLETLTGAEPIQRIHRQTDLKGAHNPVSCDAQRVHCFHPHWFILLSFENWGAALREKSRTRAGQKSNDESLKCLKRG
jgi:hypothetical protein